MDWTTLGIILTGTFVILLLGGMWIPVGLAVSGLLTLYVAGGISSFNSLGFVAWGSMNSFELIAIPLFVFMGQTILCSGISERFYRGLGRWVGRLPGGLLQSNIVGSAMFAAISGSSMTTALTMGTVAVPELDRRGYNPRMTLGSLAAGGTLGILIPPSIAMVLYGSFTQTSIAKLFVAGIAPGIVLTVLFMIYIAVTAVVRRQWVGGIVERSTSGERLRSLPDLVPIVALIGVVLGGIYFGVTTPTEAAAVGSAGALGISAAVRRLSRSVFRAAIVGTIRVTSMIMFTVLGGYIFSVAVEMVGLGRNLAEWLGSLDLSPILLVLSLTLIYIALGTVMDSIAIIVGTIPVMFPVAMAYDLDPIWFGIYMVILIELGQITPPMGVICFALQSVSGRPLGDVLRGVVPYMGIFLILLGLIAAFPALVLWLPDQMS